MTAHYSKHPYCLSCGKYVDGFREQHVLLNHRVDDYMTGGYKAVEERREPLVMVEPGEKEIKLDLAESHEDPEEEIGE